MTESEFDALLRRALIDVIHEDCADILEGEPDVPPHTEKYLRRERKLLDDPIGYVRRLARPVWKKALRMAACILLALATLFGSVMALSPSARAWVVERVSRWTQTYTEFFFNSPNAEGVSADWRPAYIPEGFKEVDTDWNEASGKLKVIYQNSVGITINLVCVQARQSSTLIIDNEHSKHQGLEINGQPADLFISTRIGFPNNLLWSNADSSTFFLLTAPIDINELVAIAKGEKENIL